MIAFDNQILKLKKNTDFRLVWATGDKKVSTNLLLIYVDNKEKHSRVGISSVKNYGNAVQRNKIIRRIKSIIPMINIIQGIDIIIIARKKTKHTKFEIIQNELISLFSTSGLSC